jgi:hypothetical protein
MQTAGNGLTVNLWYTEVCPVIELLNATGCYSCTQGAVIYIRTFSECSTGFGKISVDDKSIIVDQGQVNCITNFPLDWPIRIHVPNSENSFTMTVCDSTYQSCDSILVEFVAYKYDYNDTLFNVQSADFKSKDTRQGDQKKIATPHDLGHFFQNVFNGVAQWWEYLLFFVFIGVVVVGGMYIFKFFWWIKPKTSNKKE